MMSAPPAMPEYSVSQPALLPMISHHHAAPVAGVVVMMRSITSVAMSTAV